MESVLRLRSPMFRSAVRLCSSIYLESSTKDFRHFKTWHRLSDRYRYCRRSTRSEFRDYVVNRTVSEMFELPGRKRCYLPQECPGKRGCP